MCEILGEVRIVTARKQHEDGAFTCVDEFVDEFGFGEMDMTKSEHQSVMKRRKLNGMIQKGEKYYRYTMIDGGEIYSCQESQDMRELCIKYDLFPEC